MQLMEGSLDVWRVLPRFSFEFKVWKGQMSQRIEHNAIANPILQEKHWKRVGSAATNEYFRSQLSSKRKWKKIEWLISATYRVHWWKTHCSSLRRCDTLKASSGSSNLIGSTKQTMIGRDYPCWFNTGHFRPVGR